jgi:hypothetical protein
MKVYKIRNGKGILNNKGECLFERDLETLVSNKIYVPNITELNDPMEGFVNDKHLIEVLEIIKPLSTDLLEKYYSLKEKLNCSGIYSLTTDVNNELLWSYYGGGHSGFAIEYDLDKLKFCFNHDNFFKIFDFEVDYVKSVPVTNMSLLEKDKTCELIKKYVGVKSKSWKHEKEIRLIFEHSGLYEIDYRCVTAIYFGLRMLDEEVDIIMKGLAGRDILYFKMNLDMNTYKLYPKQIEDRYKDSDKYVQHCVEYDIEKLIEDNYLLPEQIDKYKKYFIQALEILKYEPYIEKINIISVDYIDGEPLLRIFAKVKTGLPPQREYKFKINSVGSVYLV